MADENPQIAPPTDVEMGDNATAEGAEGGEETEDPAGLAEIEPDIPLPKTFLECAYPAGRLWSKPIDSQPATSSHLS